MPDNPQLITDEEIKTSPPPDPEALFWLEQGRKSLADSVALTTVRGAATSLLTALGALQAIYIGVLGLAKFVPEDLPLKLKWFFTLPSVMWMVAISFCLRVQKSEALEINLRAPNEIRSKLEALARDKQTALDYAFGWMLAGLAMAIVLLVFRLKM